jgi:hypothetical protein
MTAVNPVPFDSPLWNQLETFTERPADMVLALRKLLGPVTDPADPALDHLVMAIFNSGSLVQATYAVFPYLIELSSRLATTNPQIYFLAANIAVAARTDRRAVPAVIHDEFSASITQFERIAIGRLMQVSDGFVRTYGEVLAAMAFSGHCVGNLLDDVFEKEGTKRTGVVCPHCAAEFQLALLDGGTVMVGPNYKIKPPPQVENLVLPVAVLYPPRDPNPWQPVASFLTNRAGALTLDAAERAHMQVAIDICNSGFSPHVRCEHAFSLIGSILQAHGFRDSARRFYRFWDDVTCPNCTKPFMVASGWWGCHANPD